MEVEERQDWNEYKQIFADHWEGFKQLYPLYDTGYYDGLVKKILSCGNPEEMGYIEYCCPNCGKGRRVVSMSCKCSLCLRCGKVYADDWTSQVSKMLHEGVIYRHIVLTVPRVLRKTFYNNPKLLRPLMQRGVQCLNDFFRQRKQEGTKGRIHSSITDPWKEWSIQYSPSYHSY